MNGRMDQGYLAWLDSLPISAQSRETYIRRLKSFFDWLSQAKSRSYSDLRTNADFVQHAHWYRQYLLQKGLKTNTINTSMVALDKYLGFRTLGKLNFKKIRAEDVAPRALTNDELKRYMRAVESAKCLRNKALISVLLHTGLRLDEVQKLKLSDIRVSRTRGSITVRCGKGMRRREVPLNTSVRNVLLEYLPVLRGQLVSKMGMSPDDLDAPVWLRRYNLTPRTDKDKTMLGPRNIDLVIRQYGDMVGLKVSAHVLRHTFLTRAVRSGVDLVTAADWAGHARLETTRRYTLPTAEEKAKEIEKLNWDSVQDMFDSVRVSTVPKKRRKATT